MRFLLIIFLGAIFFSSCITQEKCNERFPPIVKDTSYSNKILTNCVDTIREPGQIITFTDTIPCPLTAEYHKKITHNHASIQVDISKGKITATSNCDSLIRVIDSLKITTNNFREKSLLPKNIIEYRSTSFDMFCRWSALFLFLILLGFIGAKLLKFY